MGGFANSALSFMLGWVRGTAQWLWQLVSGEQGSSAIQWLGEHWLLVAAVLCVAGVVIDFMVYLARWRPDLVWRSFMRRLAKGRGQQIDELQADQAQQSRQPEHMEAMVQEEDAAEQPAVRERHRRSDKYGEGTRYARLKKVKDLVFPEEQAVTFQSYKPSKPLVNAEQTEEPGKPYIPPQWQKPKE